MAELDVDLPTFDAIVHVPVPCIEKSMGFDQSEILAEQIHRILGFHIIKF